MSPATRSNCSANSHATLVHRLFSPPRPPISFSARKILVSHMAICSCNSFFCFTMALNLSSNSFNRSITFFSSACFFLRPDITISNAASAFACASLFGLTTFATASYFTMARTQQHKPYAALDALATTFGSKLFIETYLDYFFNRVNGE